MGPSGRRLGVFTYPRGNVACSLSARHGPEQSVLPQAPARSLSLTASVALRQWFMAAGLVLGRGEGQGAPQGILGIPQWVENMFFSEPQKASVTLKGCL